MSTVPSRRMTTSAEPPKTAPAKPRKKKGASYRYGYREVAFKRPNGERDFKRTPLTLDDVLHPRFGDVHVLSDAHADDCNYLRSIFKERFASDPSVVVLSDCGIIWDIPRMRHHSPDFSLIFGVKSRQEWITFDVAKEGVRPQLIIEVTSPSTRANDVTKKVDQYAKVGVPHYVIADAVEKNKLRKLTLLVYRLENGRYIRVPLDQNGRAWLEPAGVWLGVTTDRNSGGERLTVIDPATGEPIGDYTAVAQARAQATVRAREAEAQAREAVAQTREAEARAALESEARTLAEARVKELEAELRSLRRRKS